MRLIVLLAYNLLRVLTWPVWAAWRRLRRSRARWISLQLRGSLDELPRPQRRLARLVAGMRPARRSVAEVRRLCERVADDPRALGLLLRLEHLDAGQATLASLRTELARLRARGKQIVCYLPLDAGQRELYVASVADRILAMPHAGFTALGPLAARTYLAPLLERLGLRVLVTAEGRYKSAADPLVRDSMGEAEREQLRAIVDTLHESWLDAMATRPQLGRAGAQALLDTGMFGARQAQLLGAVDELAYDDELSEKLDLEEHEQPLSHERYLRQSTSPLLRPLKVASRVALVRLVGPISERGGNAANPGIDLHGTTALLRGLAEARHISGVILHIDSPGGSAVVSELLHREIARLDAKKPVVTWMGNVAASGGYYMASATRCIVAQSTTLTGSIGVIAIRPIAEQLYAKLGLHREAVGVTPFADLNAFTRAPSAAEEALLRSETARFYDRFLEVVALGRKRPRAEIEGLAGGRVWSGRDALAVGLVDELGGYREARARLDAIDGSKTGSSEQTPLTLSPTAKPAAGLPPLRQPANAASLLLDTLGPVGALCELASRGELVLAYAAGLPGLH